MTFKALSIFLLLIASVYSKEAGKELIEPFYTDDYLNLDNPELTLSVTDSFEIDLNNNSKNDIIVLKKLNNWNDPGDFHQIVISYDNGQKFTYTNFDGWVKFGQNYYVQESIQKQNLIKSNKIILKKINNLNCIFLFGWIYASEPGLLSVISFEKEKPKIIFNTNFDIQNLQNNGFSGVYKSQSCKVEFKNLKAILNCKK